MTIQNYDALALVNAGVKSANYTAAANQMVPCDLSGGAFTVTLPTAPPDRTGMEIKIVAQAATPNTLTVACGGSDVFNVAGGSASGTLTLLNQAMRLQYSSSAAIWYVISTDVPLSQLDSRYQSAIAANLVPATNQTYNLGSGSFYWSNLFASVVSANILSRGTTSTATAAGTTTLTVLSTQVQVFTGSTTQTVLLPTTGVTVGHCYWIINQSSGAVTVQSSGGNTIAVLPANTQGLFTAQKATPTAQNDWVAYVFAQGKALIVNNSLTLAGTDGTTITFPATPSPAASTLSEWDSNANLSANAFLPSTTSTATAAGTTTLTIASTQIQVFTGTSTQTVLQPTTSVPAGFSNTVVNESTSTVTVQSSGANTIAIVPPGTSRTFTALKATPTAAADWQAGNLLSTVVEYTTTQSGLNVPAGVTGVWIERLIGPGNGGGSGRRGAAGSVRCGGGGGGASGIIANEFVPAALLGSTFTVTLPSGGTGGAAVTADNTNGNPGNIGGTASFTSGSFTGAVWPGAGGSGGTASTGSGGAGGGGFLVGLGGGNASVTGGTGGGAPNTVSGGPTGGGAGGGITSGDAASNGGTAGWQAMWFTSTDNPAGGVVGGASPSTGHAAVAGVGGSGAGGGAASITGAAQAGGTATGYGAGGGGGGASLNGNNSGKGGDGGPSYCRLRWVYV